MQNQHPLFHETPRRPLPLTQALLALLVLGKRMGVWTRTRLAARPLGLYAGPLGVQGLGLGATAFYGQPPPIPGHSGECPSSIQKPVTG